MANLLPLIQDYLPLFWVILIRVGGILVAIPAIGSRTVPLQVRIGLVIGLTVVLFPIVSDHVPLSISSPQILPLMFTELMIGMVLGFAIRFVMTAFEIAGELIGVQMGINLIGALDPVGGAGSVPIVGQFMGMLGMLVFFAIDGHHMMFEALVASFQLVPPLQFHFSGRLVEAILTLGVGMFVLALKIGAPVMTALFIVTLAMGILGRSIPQLNVMLNNVP